MDYKQLQHYQQSLLDRALAEGIRRNDEQTTTWSEYKKRHEKVIEGLEIFPKDLSVDCMVPIGKRALMRGKLTHTNEILVSLGEGYFAEYSAAQAIDLCNRRIKGANDILESLEKERNLYEMRQKIPDAFGDEEGKDLLEYWENEKLDDWRVEHRQREKEYRKKLSELRNTEKQEIQTENDLFARLDALELQEELEAELHRLEAKRPDFYVQDLGEGEVYEESDEISDETDEECEQEVNENDPKIDKLTSNLEETTVELDNESTIINVFSSNSSINSTKIDSVMKTPEKIENISQSSSVKFADFTDISEDSSTIKTRKFKTRETKVVFGESQVKYFNENDNIEKISDNSCHPKPGTSTNEETKICEISNNENTLDDDDIVRIEFNHSDNEPKILDNDGESFSSPRDIYRLFSKPKSILKNSVISSISEEAFLPTAEDSTDEEIDDSTVGISAYNNIVRDIRENVIEKPTTEIVKRIEEKRPISKFKRERANMKK